MIFILKYYKMKKQIRLTKNDLSRIVMESVNRVLKEGYGNYPEIYDKIQQIKEFMGADELIGRMTYFLYSQGLIQNFENYLYTSGHLADLQDQDDEI